MHTTCREKACVCMYMGRKIKKKDKKRQGTSDIRTDLTLTENLPIRYNNTIKERQDPFYFVIFKLFFSFFVFLSNLGGPYDDL